MERFSGVQTAGREKNCPKEQVPATPAFTLVAEVGIGTAVEGEQFVRGISWSPDGKRLLLICRADGDKFILSLYETTKWQRVQTLDFSVTLRSANWSPDGHMLVAWGEDSTTGQVLARMYEV